ncbi:MAG: hypothetical protein ACRDPO_12900, partial [Streptosporangiaceae bacterium]
MIPEIRPHIALTDYRDHETLLAFPSWKLEAAEALAATLVVMASAAGSRYASWPPIAGGVLVFALFAGTGL